MNKPRTGSGPIRVTYVIAAVNTEHAGTEGHLLRLMRRLDRERFAPNLVVMQRSEWTDQFDEADIPLDVLDFKSFQRPRDWNVVSRMAKIFRQRKSQVVELHFIDAHFAGALASKRANVPVVLSCRRDLGHQYGIKGKLLMQIGNRHVTRFVANSKIVANQMSRLERVPLNKFDVIYNGIDLTAFDAQSTTSVTPEFVQHTSGKRVVSIAANLRPVKDIEMFLSAAADVARALDDVVFVIMGDGNLRQSLQQQAERLGIENRTLFMGSVPSIAPYLVRSDVACLSSRSEGFSNSVIEYMAARLPVVVPDVGGLPEAVVDGESGYVVAAHDPQSLSQKIIDVLRMEQFERQQMGAAARRRVERMFTMERQLESQQALYARELGVVT